MAKKRRSRYKGKAYIAKALTKYFKGKYPNYRSALPRAGEIHAELKTKKQKVILKNIFPYERRKRGLRKAQIALTPELANPTNYFNLANYPMWIARVSNKIYFESTLSPAGLDLIQGGTIPDYTTYFADYVNYINAMKGQSDPEENRYETEWMVVCTEPIKQPNGTYLSKIISLDGDGDPFDYGFDPNNPSVLPGQLVLSTPEPKPQPKPTTQVPGTAGTVSKTAEDVEFERQKSMQDLMSLYREGLITKQEFNQYMDKIK